MKGKAKTVFICTMAVLVGGLVWAATPAKAGGKVDPDKEKALANPYANDLGPADVDVSAYPKDVQAGYKLMKDKCTKCHTTSRPLNAQFVELSGAEAEAFKKQAGAAGKNEHVYKMDDGVWKRYVKRMAAKPGCELSKTDDQKAIYKFLVHDSKVRKTGDQIETWVKHRKGLLEEFKKSKPARYKELYEDGASEKEDKK